MDELPAYTPQALTDLLPIYRPTDASDDHIHTYTLLQNSDSRQILSSAEDSPAKTPPLHIKTFKTGGFMNRKPHIVISHPSSSGSTNSDGNHEDPLAEARFDVHGTGTSIHYGNGNGERAQRLELEDSRMQVLKTTVGGMPHWWQPHPGNKHVWELTNEFEDVIARFVYSPSSPAQSRSPPQARSPPLSPRLGRERSNSILSIAALNAEGAAKKSKCQETAVGELHVVDGLVGGEEEREEILCSAVVVVERMRRRQAILQNKGSPYGITRSIGRNGVAYIPQ